MYRLLSATTPDMILIHLFNLFSSSKYNHGEEDKHQHFVNKIPRGKHRPTTNLDYITGSELVRKYVTFHFYFPVGQHHPPDGNPILTNQNGLLMYKANCDKVSTFLCEIKCFKIRNKNTI